MLHTSSAGAAPSALSRTRGILKGRYADWLAGMLVSVVIRLIALSPLMALALTKEGDPLRLISLAAPILYLFAVLPLRYSFGETMSRALSGEPFSAGRLLSFQGYGRKLKAVILQGLHLLPWALPIMAAGGVTLYFMHYTDGVSLLMFVRSLGKLLGEQSGLKEGVYMLSGFAGLLVLLLLFGMMRNGMVRFLWLKSGGDYKAARRLMLQSLKGRRGGQFWAGLFQGALALPALLAEAYLGYRMFRLGTASPKLALLALGVFFALYWLLLPLRKILQAVYIDNCVGRG